MSLLYSARRSMKLSTVLAGFAISVISALQTARGADDEFVVDSQVIVTSRKSVAIGTKGEQVPLYFGYIFFVGKVDGDQIHTKFPGVICDRSVLKPLERAEREATKTIESDPDADAYAIRGFLRDRARNYQGALGDFSESLRLRPNDKRVMWSRASCFGFLKREEEQLAALAEIMALDPTYWLAYSSRAHHYKMKEKYELALEDYNRVIELRPGDWYALRSRSDVLFALGKHVEALEDASRAIECCETPFNKVSMLSYRARHFSRLGQFERQIQDLEQALEAAVELAAELAENPQRDSFWLSGQEDEVLIKLGDALMNDSRFADAEKTYRRVSPPKASTRNAVTPLLAQALLQQGRFKDCLEELDAELVRKPDNFYASYAKAEAYRQVGDLDSAFTSFRDTTGEVVAPSTIFDNYAALMLEQGRLLDAAKELKAERRHFSLIKSLFTVRAMIEAAEGKTEEALKHLAEAVKADNVAPSVLIARGVVPFVLGRARPAVDDLRRAVKRSPYDQSLAAYLAACEFALGEARANETVKSGLSIGTQSSQRRSELLAIGILSARQQQQPMVEEEFRTLVGTMPPSLWTTSLLDWSTGSITGDQLLSAADTPSHRRLSHAIVGIEELQKGHREEAAVSLEKIRKETGVSGPLAAALVCLLQPSREAERE
jgi:tetratricopeptide (TPR) repeat protein